MTKTSAARKFAAKHGTYDPIFNEYRLADQSSISTIETVLRQQRNEAQNAQRVMADRAEEAKEQHTADLRLVMALLGVEDQYEDTVEPRTDMWFGYPLTKDVVTKTAVQKFAEDLRAAQSAIDGAAALKRIRKAIKNVKKEADK